MWFDQVDQNEVWKAGVRRLSRVDPVLRKIIKQVGPCSLAPRKDYFVVLCKSIFSQQISVAVATVLFARFRKQFPAQRPTPARVIDFLTKTDPAIIRGCGISRQKQGYLLDLARHFESGKLPTARFGKMTDEQIITALDDVQGIGRWTAEMFLIFVLNRPDVWPVDDLGLRKNYQRAFNLPEMPKPKALIELGEPFRPYRSLATWYLWRMPTTANSAAS